VKNRLPPLVFGIIDPMKNLAQALGPGILFASTAIGVSHLVQSTRAGAEFGFALIWAVLLANIFKYPFFEFGSRYANAMGESLIDGYQRIGKWMVWLYFLIMLGSMFFVMAAVGAVTSGFLDNLFGIGHLKWVTVGVFVLCVIVLIFGKYKILDSMIKIIGAVLLLSTLMAFILTLGRGPSTGGSLISEIDLSDAYTFTFLIALMGWMPTAVDLSTWNSLWTLERINQTGYHPPLKQTLFDFNFGYITSALLSICFVTMGAYIMFGTNCEIPNSSAAFAHNVVEMYTASMGDWSYFIIATAAFSIMFGTCIAVFDGYSRAMQKTSELLFLSRLNAKKALSKRKIYVGSLLILAVGAFGVIYYMLFHKADSQGFKALIDLATTISFLIAPVIAIVNYRLVTWKHYPDKAKPKLWLKILAISGIIFLSGFSIIYVLFKLGVFE